MSFDHIRDHNFIGFLSQDPGPRINKYGDPKDFTATTIKSTTTFVTKSGSVAAPYWGISGRDAQDMTILKVKMYVSHIAYRFLLYPPCSSALVPQSQHPLCFLSIGMKEVVTLWH